MAATHTPTTVCLAGAIVAATIRPRSARCLLSWPPRLKTARPPRKAQVLHSQALARILYHGRHVAAMIPPGGSRPWPDPGSPLWGEKGRHVDLGAPPRRRPPRKEASWMQLLAIRRPRLGGLQHRGARLPWPAPPETPGAPKSRSPRTAPFGDWEERRLRLRLPRPRPCPPPTATLLAGASESRSGRP